LLTASLNQFVVKGFGGHFLFLGSWLVSITCSQETSWIFSVESSTIKVYLSHKCTNSQAKSVAICQAVKLRYDLIALPTQEPRRRRAAPGNSATGLFVDRISTTR
jgi:hypothetical protein